MSTLVRTLLELSLGIGVAAGLLLVLRPMLRRRYTPRLFYWAWLLLALRLLVPANLSLPQAPVRLPEPEFYVNLPVAFAPAQGAGALSGADGAAPPAPVTPADPLPVVRRFVLDGWQVTALLWAVGALVTGVLLFLPHLGFLRQVRRWRREETDPAVLSAYAAAGEALGVTRPPLYRCPAVSSPMAVGLFRPMLLLPEEALPDGALAAVFRHELIHIRRRDLWYKLALLLCRCLHWFNPLVHLMARAAERDLERSCDAAAVAGEGDGFRAAYGRAILDAVQTAPIAQARLTTYFGGGKQAMLERLGSILDGEGKKRGAAVLALVLATAVGLTLCVNAGGGVVHTLGEFRLELPSGVTTLGPDYGPYGPVRFYENEALVGGADWYQEGAPDGTLVLPDWLPLGRVDGSEVITTRDFGPALEAWSVTLEVEEETGRHSEIHYYYQLSGQALLDLWFRLDRISPGEAERAAEGLLLGDSPSERGDLSLSSLAHPEGVQWLLYQNDRLMDAVVVPGGRVLHQMAQWSPDGAWASVTDAQRLVLLFPQGEGLGMRPADLWDADALTFLGWTADSRLHVSYVRDVDGVLESGTALYDPVADSVGDVLPAPDASLVAVTPVGSQGGPGWVMPLPDDVRAVPDPEGALLYRGEAKVGEAKVGEVRWKQLTAEQRTGMAGLISFSINSQLSETHLRVMLPLEGGWAYELSLNVDALSQDLCYAMAKSFTVDGVPLYKVAIPREGAQKALSPVSLTAAPSSALGPAPELVNFRWTNYGREHILFENLFSLERVEDGQWVTVVPPETPAFTMEGYALSPGSTLTHSYPLSSIYGPLPSGQYRVATNYSVDAPSGPNQKYPVYGTFEVP